MDKNTTNMVILGVIAVVAIVVLVLLFKSNVEAQIARPLADNTVIQRSAYGMYGQVGATRPYTYSPQQWMGYQRPQPYAPLQTVREAPSYQYGGEPVKEKVVWETTQQWPGYTRPEPYVFPEK